MTKARILFWNTFEVTPPLRASRTFDVGEGAIDVAFDVGDSFLNAVGIVQGGSHRDAG